MYTEPESVNLSSSYFNRMWKWSSNFFGLQLCCQTSQSCFYSDL